MAGLPFVTGSACNFYGQNFRAQPGVDGTVWELLDFISAFSRGRDHGSQLENGGLPPLGQGTDTFSGGGV